MLDMQTKQNKAAAPVAFVNDEHDGAEFNSMANELKKAILDQGGSLTPLNDYATENIYQLATALIAGSGYLYVPTVQSANAVEITQAGASTNSLPTLAQMTNKIARYIASASNTSATVNVKWGAGSNINIINIDGSPLNISQIKTGSLVSIMYNGTKWVLLGNEKNFIIDANGNMAYNGASIQADIRTDYNTSLEGRLRQCTLSRLKRTI